MGEVSVVAATPRWAKTLPTLLSAGWLLLCAGGAVGSPEITGSTSNALFMKL